MHINRKHTKYDENVTSLQCQNCGEEFRNAGEFKEHMIWRSYQQLKFNGYECDSWGSKKQTIEMHIRRIHSETVACGMCEFEGKDIETLMGKYQYKMHLVRWNASQTIMISVIWLDDRGCYIEYRAQSVEYRVWLTE